MKKVLITSLAIWLGVMSVIPLWAAATTPAGKPAPAQKADASPGKQAAETLSLLTGVAISPLLGTGAVGAYQYMTAKEPAQKSKLPWYAQPWFWVPAMLLVGATALKDTIGAAMPAIKKPLDVAEVVENKVSGLVAAGAFVPLVANFFPSGTASAMYDGLFGFAALDMGDVLNMLSLPFALAVFAVVWLASHAITILIVISPFTVVDAALKSCRTALIGVVAGLSFINPYLSALLSIVIIIIAYLIAGWSFRLTVFGTAFAWDSMTFRRKRFTPLANNNWMFTAVKLEKVPVRTYGKLTRDEQGKFTFEYRPWLFLSKRTLSVPETGLAVGKALVFPEIVRVEGPDKRHASLFTLPPRYMTHEAELARAYAIGQCEVGLLAGAKAAWNWLKGFFGMKPESATQTAPA
ncbi:MAG: hypothetical protein WCO56_19715 [Verrucomicrobiota bacterium]